MKFFPTQIDTYKNCPRKYFYSRDREIRAKYSKASPHLVLGNAVHDALEAFFDLGKVPMAERTYERLQNLLRAAWGGSGVYRRNNWKQKKAREEAFGGDRANEKAWGERGMNILYRFFQTADLAVVPLTTEQFHELRLTQDITLGGKIDRIDRNEDGSLVIIDYKTGKPPRKQDAESLAQRDLQLAAYALVVSRKFRGKVARCSYLYLDHELELGFEPTDELLAAKEAELVQVCDEMLAKWKTEDFEPTPNPLCNWCDYQELCPVGDEWEKRKSTGVAPDELPF